MNKYVKLTHLNISRDINFTILVFNSIKIQLIIKYYISYLFFHDYY